MSRGYGWRGGCSATAVSDGDVGSVEWFGCLEVFRAQAGVSCNTCQHPWANLIAVVKCENVIGKAMPLQDSV